MAMKKLLACVLFALLLSTCSALSFSDADGKPQEPTNLDEKTVYGPWRPCWGGPGPWQRPGPIAHPPQPAPGSVKPPSIEQIHKCWSDFITEHRCIGEIYASFWTHRVQVGQECCSIVKKITKDCALAIFADTFYARMLTAHCAKQG